MIAAYQHGHGLPACRVDQCFDNVCGLEPESRYQLIDRLHTRGVEELRFMSLISVLPKG
ncbi:hypothetical protein D3C73_1411550 [compost metagenome]